MTGIEKIIAHLEADAQADMDVINAEAKAQCEAIAAEYSEKAAAEYDLRMKEGQKACAVREERLLSTADMEERKSILAFKQEMVSEVFADAVKCIVNLPENEYVAFLAALAAKAATYGTEELIFNEKDAKSVGKEVCKAANAILGANGKLTVAEETRPMVGGLVLKQGDIEVNCAVDTLVQLKRSDLASQVAEILFA